MAAMLDGRNNEMFLHEFFFPEERICIVPAIQHGRHAKPSIRDVYILRISLLTKAEVVRPEDTRACF